MRQRVKAALIQRPAIFGAAKFLDLAARYARRGVHDADYRLFANFHGQDGLFVDVGANIGQSALSFAATNRRMRIMSFEANRLLEPDLRRVRRILGPRFRYQLCGLGASSAMSELFVPKCKRTLLTQEGTLHRTELESSATLARVPRGFSIERVWVRVVAFDSLNMLANLVKIDVQGHEAEVVAGMIRSIERDHPVIMVERGPDDAVFHRIFGMLHPHGYDAFRFDPSANRLLPIREPAGLNYFAVPAARANGFAARARKIVVERR